MFEELSTAVVADSFEIMHFINVHRLHGAEIGYVDAHLLAAVRLTPEATLWTRDNCLKAVADRLSLTARLAH